MLCLLAGRVSKLAGRLDGSVWMGGYQLGTVMDRREHSTDVFGWEWDWSWEFAADREQDFGMKAPVSGRLGWTGGPFVEA